MTTQQHPLRYRSYYPDYETGYIYNMPPKEVAANLIKAEEELLIEFPEATDILVELNCEDDYCNNFYLSCKSPPTPEELEAEAISTLKMRENRYKQFVALKKEFEGEESV